PNGKMSAERWRLNHSKLVDALFVRMRSAPDSPMHTFEGIGWMNDIKILKCKDDPNWAACGRGSERFNCLG
ncbi:hypothetical protein KR215_009287, partial [Drosophila sulfurigaster]